MRAELDIVENGLTVDVHLKCPFLDCSGSVTFVVDTGSGKTLLSEKDSKRLEIDLSKLRRSSEPIWGIGGLAIGWDLPEVLLFLETDEGLDWLPMDDVIIYKVPIRRRKGITVRPRSASILGRDYLKNSEFELIVDMKNDEAYLKK